MPIVNATIALADQPRSATSLTAKTVGSIATIDRPALTKSNAPGLGSFDSGTSRGANTARRAVTGIPTVNTEPHQ